MKKFFYLWPVFLSLFAMAQQVHLPTFPLNNYSRPVSAGPGKTSGHTRAFGPQAPVEHRRTCLVHNIKENDEYEPALADRIRKAAQLRTQEEVYVIPVVVHVIHSGEAPGTGANISYTQVQSQIDALNEDFRRKASTPGFNSNPVGADSKIEFVLAPFGPGGETLAEAGVNRRNLNRTSWNSIDAVNGVLKPATQWNPEKYLNIWVCNFGGDIKDLLGYAQFPNLSGLSGLEKNMGEAVTDGVVIKYTAFGRSGNVRAPYNKGRTLTHEVGHWLGLRHIWGDGDCSRDDFCNDTPTAGEPNYSCTDNNSCAGGGNDMIENYMDYTPDACMNIFTAEQVMRMRTVLQNSPRRRELTASKIAPQANKPAALLEYSKTYVCQNGSVLFTDNSVNSPTSRQWTFFDDKGNVVLTSTASPLNVIFSTDSGVYGVQLIVSNANGSDTARIENAVVVLGTTGMALPFTETFAVTTLDDWLRFNPQGDKTFEDAFVSAYGNGNWSLMFDNYDTITDLTGTFDMLISPRLNMSTYTGAYLSFDVAYARYDDYYADTLAVFVFTECGAEAVSVWAKGGRALATAPDTDELFVPKSSQWRNEKISLSELNGKTITHIAIANISGWGNAVYIDNIKLLVPNPGAKPAVNFYAAEDTVCSGDEVVFSDASTNYPTAWSWIFEGGTAGSLSSQFPVVYYPQPGVFDVSLTAGNAIGAANLKRQDYITVLPTPELDYSSGGALPAAIGDPITIVASGADYYYWYTDPGLEFVVGTEDTFSTIAGNNFVTLLGINENGCYSLRRINLTAVGLDPESVVGDELIVFPNPAGNEVFVKLPDGVHSPVQWQLLSPTGTVAANGTGTGSTVMKIDLGHLPAGLYLCRVLLPTGPVVKRFIKY